MAEAVLEIVQDRGKGKLLSAMLVKGRELRIEKAVNRKSTSYFIDVVALKDESQRKIVLGWKWGVAGLVFVLISLIFPLLLPSLFTETLIKYFVYLAGMALGAGCFYMAWKATTVKQIFYSRNADVPLVELIASKPSKEEFKDFVAKIEESILDVQKKLNLSHKKQLAGEMKMLRRLSEEGVLSASDYKKAKAVLLAMH